MNNSSSIPREIIQLMDKNAGYASSAHFMKKCLNEHMS